VMEVHLEWGSAPHPGSVAPCEPCPGVVRTITSLSVAKFISDRRPIGSPVVFECRLSRGPFRVRVSASRRV
jgi:hypothetical protein